MPLKPQENGDRWATLIEEVLRLFERLRHDVQERVADEQLRDGCMSALAQQEALVSQRNVDVSSNESAIPVAAIRSAIQFAGFAAGVISYFQPSSQGPRNHEATWCHVHTLILYALQDRTEGDLDRGLLALLEVARGEISEVYRLHPIHRREGLVEECTLFFEALDLAANSLADYLGLQLVVRRTEEGCLVRSKYSGDSERYPIDIRTCVINDILRYFPGQSITIPERIFQAVQATYHESINQLCPEDTDLLSGLLLSTPVLAFALRDADFSPEAFIDDKLSITPHDHPTWGYAWTVSLDRIFFDNDGSPTAVARRTVASKQFGAFELLDGILESMTRPWGHMTHVHFVQKCLQASPAFASKDVTEEELIAAIRERSRIAQGIDPSFAWQQLGLYLDDTNAVRTVAFSPWSASRFRDWSEESQGHRFVRGNLEQNAGWLSHEVLSELEWLIAQDLPEASFQGFLEKNPNVLLGLGPYERAIPHVILHQDDGQKLIPDFFLEIADGRGADLLELKLPTSKIDLRQARRERFRAGIYEAVAQLRSYRDWFQSGERRDRFLAKTGINCFRPRALLVFGRSMDFQSHVDRQRIEATLPEWARLFTYDDLLSSARQWMRQSR